MEETRLLNLDSVTVDNGLNPRVGALDQEAVMDYAAHVDDLPPMVVYQIPGEDGYLLAAGFHRIAAHRLAGKNEARFVVREGSRADAAEFADLDNLKHGLQLSRAERREVIKRQLKRHPDWSDVRLAAACMTTDKTVRSVREALEQTSEIPRHDVLVGADGIGRPRTVSRPPVGEASAKIVDGKLEMTLGPLGDSPAETHRIDLSGPTSETEPDDDQAGPDPDGEAEIQAEAEQERREVDPMPAAEDVKAHQPAPIKLEMAPAPEPDTVVTITIKASGACMITVTGGGQASQLLAASRPNLLAKLAEILKESEPQPAEWLEA